MVVSFFHDLLKKKLPFTVKNKNIRIHKVYLKKMVGFGAPGLHLRGSACEHFIFDHSGNRKFYGSHCSAGVGVAEKVCAFIMLISSAFMQSMSAFEAQNYGAGQITRARKALHYGIAVSFSIGVVMFLITFFHGDALAGIFSSDGEVVFAAADYLKAYADRLSCLQLFSSAIPDFTMVSVRHDCHDQGTLAHFASDVPVSYIMSIQAGNIAVSTYRAGNAGCRQPCS